MDRTTASTFHLETCLSHRCQATARRPYSANFLPGLRPSLVRTYLLITVPSAAVTYPIWHFKMTRQKKSELTLKSV